MTPDDRLAALVALSLELGDPARDYVILSEGNTSARIDERSFWVSASGVRLAEADREGAFVAVESAPLMAAMRGDADDDARRILRDAMVGGPDDAGPSIESFVHAICFELGGVAFVGHTHPTPVNALLSSRAAEAAYTGTLSAEEAARLGPAPVLVPYAEPGLALGRAVLARFEALLERHGEPPRALLLANHGLVALGDTPEEVAAVTQTAVKGARIRLGALAAGGLRFV
jgi:rhamnose utilization protein RhaD (predicted bifunctional aldolase and dehydrogenase)